MNEEEARQEFEKRGYEVDRTTYRGRLDPHGKPFISLTSGGIKPEGDPTPVLCSTPEIAWGMFWDQLAQRFPRDKRQRGAFATILIREWPSLTEVPRYDYLGELDTRYFVYSRLSIRVN